MLKELGIKITHNIKDLITQSKKAEADLERLSKKKVDIQVQLDKKKDLQNQMKAIQAEITKINAKKLDIKVKINNVKDQLGEIEKSLTDKKHKIQVSAELGDDSAVSTLFKEIQELERKKIKLSVDVTEGTDAIKRLNQDADELRSKKANIKVQADGIEETKSDLTAVDKQIRDINGRKIKIDAFSAGQSISKGLGYLSDFSGTLSKISFKPLELGARAAMNVVQQLSGVAKGLFNELEGDINMEKVFRQNQGLMGVDSKKVDAIYKELDRYADKTIYNGAEMMNTYNSLANSGSKDATKLVKGLGAIAATAEDSSAAMNSLSTQFSQAMLGGLQRTDFKIMSEATNGGLKVAFDQAGKDYQDFFKRLADANELKDPGIRERLAKELEQVVLAAADNPKMNELAETPKTIAQGTEALTASLVNIVRKGFTPLQEVGIKWLSKLAEDLEGIDKEKIAKFGDDLADFADNKLKKLYELAKNTDFKKLWSELQDGFSDGLSGLKKHLGMYKTLFKGAFKIDLKDMDIYEVANKIGEIIPKLLEYGIKFKEASLLFKGASAGFDVFSTIARYANIKLPFGKLFKGLGADSGKMITAPKVNTGAFKAFAKGLGIIAGLEGTILLGAKALQEVDKIKIGNQLPSKLRNLGLAVAAMGAFAGIVGGLITAVPAGGAALIIGAGTITGISATLAASAKAVKSLDGIKVEGDYVQKVKAIGKVLTELSTTTGGLLKNNGFAVLGNFGAMLNSKLKGVSLKEYGKMAETLNSLANMPEIKTEDIKKKLRAVKTSLSVLDEGENWHDVPILSNLVDFFNSISATWEAVKDKANASSLKSFAGMIKSLESLGGDFDPDTKKIKGNISKIKDALDSLNDEKLPNTLWDDATSFIKGIGAKIDAFVKEADAEKLTALVSTLKPFETLGTAEISTKKIKKNLKELKSTFKAINESGIASLDLTLKQDKKGNISGLLSEDNTKAISNLGKIVETLKTVMESINSLGGNINIENIRTNIPLIGEVMSLLNQNIQKGDSGDTMSTAGFKGFSSRIKYLKEIMNNINSLSANIEIASVRTNVEILGDLLSLLNTAFNRNINDDLMKVEGFKGFKSRLESLREIMGILGDLAANIPNGGADVRANIAILGSIFSSMNTFINKGINDDLMKVEGFKGLKTRLITLKEIMTELDALSQDIPNGGQAVKDNILVLGSIFNSMNTFLNKTINDDLMKVEGVKGLKTRLITLKEIMGELESLSQNIPNGGQAVKDNIAVLATIFNSMNTFINRTINDDLMKVEGFKGLKTRLIVLKEIIGELEGLSQNIPNGGQAVKDNIGVLATIFNSMNTFLNKEINDDLMSIEGFEGLSTRLDILREMFGKLEGLGTNIPEGGQAVKDNIGILLSIFDQVQLGEREFRHVSEMLPIYQKAIKAVGAMTNIITTLNTIPTMPINYDAVYNEIESVRRLLVQINDLPSPEGIAEIQALIQEFTNLISTLNGLAGQFRPVGVGYGKQLIEGFKSVDFNGPATAKIKSLINKLMSLNSYFREAGRQAGKAYGDGLTSKLESVDVSSAGTKLGNQLKTNLLNSLSGISSAIEESINASAIASRVSSTLSNAASSVRSSSSSSSSRIGPPAPGRWFGGLIGNSTSFAGHETEEIRASKGEFMMPRSSVRKYGTSLMEAMRNLSFEFPTMPAMQTVSTSNISNKSNVDNSNHSATVIIQGAKNDAKNRMRANKYLRSKGL